MEFVDSTRVEFLLCIWLLLLVLSTCSQEGFVSLECCAKSANTEPKTNLSWIPDSDLLPVKGRCLSVALPVPHDTSYKDVRIFDTDNGNWTCYNLTTTTGHDFLIRGTFLHGTSLQISPHTIFNVSIGATSIAQVSSSIDFLEAEGVFRATNPYVNFCLVKGRGSPFLSKLELRPLDDPRYLNGDPSIILKRVARVDLGGKGDIRYSNDSSDRIWTANASFTPIDTPVSIYGAIPSVPIRVLQTAVTNKGELQFLHHDLKVGDQDYLVFLYFVEHNQSVKTGQRVFDIYINGAKTYTNFDILQNGTASNYREVYWKVNANGVLNISLIKNSDAFGLDPICSAYETFEVHNRVAETSQDDVDAIMTVKEELTGTNPKANFLGSWSGDPCVPSAWPGLTCSQSNGNSSFVITKLNLTSKNLEGPIPTGISELKQLKEISGDCENQDSLDPPRQRNIVIIGTVTGGSVLFTIALGVIVACAYRRLRHPDATKHAMTKNAIFSISSMDEINVKPICIQVFTLQCIQTATNIYQTMIGEGGFGAVYRGTLAHGQEVAVKVRSATSTQGTREFENELNLLSAIRHENLVPLLGYCCENDQQILVYPFMSNGSLQDRLYGEASKRKPLDWQTRLSIALGAARGMDVKSSNILLDHSMCAKVADFGFSKYAPQEGDSGASLEVRGTAGYLDPEYYSTQKLSVKSDVFSFGVVLLEIISGREPLNIHRPRNEWSLLEWAKSLFNQGRSEEIVDPNIKGGYTGEAMWRVMEVALGCIEPFSTHRPFMADIIRELEDALIIENNSSEYMKSIESLGGSNRYNSIDRKAIPLPIIPTPPEPSPTPTEPSPIFSQNMAPPQPR
ncbi:hypothetical protein ACLOJK_003207 [Asimina triloba]